MTDRDEDGEAVSNVKQFTKKKTNKLNLDATEIKGLESWDWNDFRTAWLLIAQQADENAAWQAIFDLWQVRAGEVNK
jgi:hypothetical protein